MSTKVFPNDLGHYALGVVDLKTVRRQFIRLVVKRQVHVTDKQIRQCCPILGRWLTSHGRETLVPEQVQLLRGTLALVISRAKESDVTWVLNRCEGVFLRKFALSLDVLKAEQHAR